jgi:hypothetical protein
MSTAPEEVREPGLPAVYAVRGADHDNIVFLREASWDDFQALSRMRGEHSAPRLSYLCDEADYRKLGVAEVWWWRKGRLTLRNGSLTSYSDIVTRCLSFMC